MPHVLIPGFFFKTRTPTVKIPKEWLSFWDPTCPSDSPLCGRSYGLLTTGSQDDSGWLLFWYRETSAQTSYWTNSACPLTHFKSCLPL